MTSRLIYMRDYYYQIVSLASSIFFFRFFWQLVTPILGRKVERFILQRRRNFIQLYPTKDPYAAREPALALQLNAVHRCESFVNHIKELRRLSETDKVWTKAQSQESPLLGDYIIDEARRSMPEATDSGFSQSPTLQDRYYNTLNQGALADGNQFNVAANPQASDLVLSRPGEILRNKYIAGTQLKDLWPGFATWNRTLRLALFEGSVS